MKKSQFYVRLCTIAILIGLVASLQAQVVLFAKAKKQSAAKEAKAAAKEADVAAKSKVKTKKK